MAWLWFECEDYILSSGDTPVVDDWGAAAHRFVRLAPSASIVCRSGKYTSYSTEEDMNGGYPWGLTLRYRHQQDRPVNISIDVDGSSYKVKLPAVEHNRWGWASATIYDLNDPVEIAITAGKTACELDGFFLHNQPIDLPDDVRVLDPLLGQSEAEEAAQDYMRELVIPGGVTPRFGPATAFPSETAREAAGDLWPVLQTLAQKPCPYIVSAYDIGKGTDYNADYSWHALDKEKRWELPWSGALGVVNPNSDLSYIIGFSFDEEPVSYQLDFRPVLHLANLVSYEVDLDPLLRCEVTFTCHDSSTLLATVHIANAGDEDRRVIVGQLLAKDRPQNPPFQRYTLPGQMFGSGVTTTAGGLAWTGLSPEGGSVAACFYEWIRGRSRGRRLLATLAWAQKGEKYQLDPAREEETETPYAGVLGLKHPVVVHAGETVVVALALNMRRFTTFDTWNPEITSELYRPESEEVAQEAGYLSCAEAISADIEGLVRASIEPYKTFPQISLPQKSWEADFYACLELPRASTFSPLGNLQTPFYNFCRVHAHDPFGWWSYGMHAHESLCTLFNNIVDPHLSANFLLGHIRHQQEDGKYPYGVSHTISPRLKTEEATAPLIVWEAWNSYLWSGDESFLREAYASGRENHEWWITHRDRCGEGLCHWLDTCNESVRDDKGLPTWIVTGGSQYQEALDLNCYLLVQEQTLSKMAKRINETEGDEEGYLGGMFELGIWDNMSARRAKTMNAHMWHDADQCYYGIGEVVPTWANVKDISTFFPLWAKLAPNGRFEPIANLLDDPETFGLPYGPPTLAKNEPCFAPQKHWYGSNWVEMSLFPILGLRNYGYYRKAADLAHQNTKMVFDELERYGHFREYFNSVEGNGTDLIDYIWSAMPAYFIISVFFGIEPRTAGLSILPALPEGWQAAEIKNLHIRGMKISISVSIDPNASETTVKFNGSYLRTTEERGAFIHWERLHDSANIKIIQPATIPETHTAPPEAPEDWSDVPPHDYPDDKELVQKVRAAMKDKGQCG